MGISDILRVGMRRGTLSLLDNDDEPLSDLIHFMRAGKHWLGTSND